MSFWKKTIVFLSVIFIISCASSIPPEAKRAKGSWKPLPVPVHV